MATDTTPPAVPWTLLSSPVPPETPEAALVTDPDDGAARLVTRRAAPPAPGLPDDGSFDLWRWVGDRWSLESSGLLPRQPAGPSEPGRPLAWYDPAEGGLVLACIDAGALWVASRARPEAIATLAHPALEHWSSLDLAFRDAAAGCVWILHGGHDGSVLLRLVGRELAEVCRGPILVHAVYDEARGVLLARDVANRGHRFDGTGWRPAPELDGLITALAWDPTRNAVIALLVQNYPRVDLVTIGAKGWQYAQPELYASAGRHGAVLGVDRAQGQVLAFGGQDFEDASGSPSRQTLHGRAGQMLTTVDHWAPPWGPCNTLVTTEAGLLAVNHGSVAVHRRTAEGRWERVGSLFHPWGVNRLDPRALNVAWGDGTLWALESDGARSSWRPGEALESVTPAGGGPGRVESHRTAMGWDPHWRRVVVCGGARRSETWASGGGLWRKLAAAPRGVGCGASTPAGFYVLSDASLWSLQDDAWVAVGPAPRPRASALRYDPRRRALLAASPEGVSVLAADGWRWVIALPAGADLRGWAGGDAELGVDPVRDELVVCDRARAWSVPLAALDLAGAVLPTDPAGPKHRGAGGTPRSRGTGESTGNPAPRTGRA